MATITKTEAADKACPKGYRWRGYFNKRTPEYTVFWERGAHDFLGSSANYTLSESRKEAQSLVKEGSKWAEIYRWAENGSSLRKVLIATYSREA